LLPLLLICTYGFVDYGTMISEIAQMALGNLPVHEEFTFLSGALNIMAISVFAIILAFGSLAIVTLMVGKDGDEIETSRFTSLKGVDVVVFLEELLARGLLFWLPLQLSGYNIVVFYIFWILSNGIWALLHLTNYKEDKRSLWLVLPQFIGGLFIESYAFLKFGFWIAYAIHLFYDFILFSMIGHEDLKSSLLRNLPSRVIAMGLGALLIGVASFSFSSFNTAVTQLPYLEWLDGNFTNDATTIFPFIGFLLIMTNIIGLVCDLAGMDEKGILNILRQNSSDSSKIRIMWIIGYILSGMLIPILLLINYYLTSWITIPILNFFTPLQNPTNATFLLGAFIMSSIGRATNKKGEKTSPSVEFRSFLVKFPFYFLLFVYMTKVSILLLFVCTTLYMTISGIIKILRI